MLPIADESFKKSHKTPLITIGLIGVNILVFFLTFFAPSFESLVLAYGVNPSNFAILQLVTSQFLHGGFSHLIFNLWSLWIFGDNLEIHLGTIKYLLVYLISGSVGGLAFLLSNAGDPTPAIGASGAIAGVLGGYLILFPQNRVIVLSQLGSGTVPAIYYIGLWFLIQFIFFSTGGDQGIAFSAHIGGFLTGLLLTKILARGT